MAERLRVCRLPRNSSEPDVLTMVRYDPWTFSCQATLGSALRSMVEQGYLVPMGHCLISRAFGECGRGFGEETLSEEEQAYLEDIKTNLP